MGSDFKDIYGDWPPEEGEDKERHDPSPSQPPSSEPDEETLKELFRKWDLLDEETAALPPHSSDKPIEARQVHVINVFQETTTASIFVLLKDNMGRRLRINIEKGVAFSIAMALERSTPDRPGTHDLMKNIIERLGATIDHVIIDDLYQSIFYSKIVLSHQGKLIEIDSRSSDAIAMALRFDAPIYVAETVLEAVQSDM